MLRLKSRLQRLLALGRFAGRGGDSDRGPRASGLSLRTILTGGQLVLTVIALLPAVLALRLANQAADQQAFAVNKAFPTVSAFDELNRLARETTQGTIIVALMPAAESGVGRFPTLAQLPRSAESWFEKHGELITQTCNKAVLEEVRTRLRDLVIEGNGLAQRQVETGPGLSLVDRINRVRYAEMKLHSVVTNTMHDVHRDAQFELAAARDALGMMMFFSMIAGVLAIGLGLLLSLRVAGALQGTIGSLIEAAGQIGGGDMSARARRSRLPVMARLIDAFNEMCDHVEQAHRRYRRERDDLAADVERRIEAEQRLEGEANRDPLTRLSNRTVLMDRLDQCIERKKREEAFNYALLFLDLDRFKVVNDSLGHHIGDHLLLEAASRLSQSVRKLDTVVRVDKETTARLGGDEFAILLEGIANPSRAVLVAERIQAELIQPFRLDGYEIGVQSSIGIAIGSTLHERANDVLRDADTAMYRAKVAGGSQHAVFDDVMHREVKARLHLENDLRRAVENQNFIVMYQPIVDLATGRTIAFESLIRWVHPQRGVIGPDQFIGLAEETSLITPIGKWMLNQACRQLRAWRALLDEDHPLAVSVNVSPRQVTDCDLVEVVDRTLRETGLDARYLRLEITESMIMNNARSIKDIFDRLKKLGVELYLDDFGTGYSSLSCLHNFPIDVLKIDREFMLNVESNSDYASIVRAIMTLARSLNLRVTVEGIETPEQVELVNRLGCHYGQGHYFSEPLDPRAAWAHLTRERQQRATA